MKLSYNSNEFKRFISSSWNIIITALCIFVAFCLTAYPKEVIESIREAIKICCDTVIPSLFPFLFLSSFLSRSGTSFFENKLFDKISEKLFALPPEGFFVFIMGAVGGFPVGAKTACNLLENGRIGKETAKRLIFSCVCPAPAFAVTAVGYSLFDSTKTGIILYSSVVISNFILFILSRFIFSHDKPLISSNHHREKLSVIFTKSGSAASESMISICCYVLLFSCLCDITKIFIENELITASVCAFFEVTTGCRRLAFLGNLPLIAGIIGWGGLSVHFQISTCAEKAGLSVRLLFLSRAVCAFLSVIICDALLYIFPTVTDVISLRRDIVITSTEKNLPVSFMMLLTCFIFLIGDYKIKNTANSDKM